MELLTNILIYGFLGFIQGISEPIPISSSGHLVIFQNIFEKFGVDLVQASDITFEVIVNTGSLVAILFYYRRDISILFKSFFGYLTKPNYRHVYQTNFNYCLLIILATIPAGIVGLLFSDVIEGAFNNPKMVGCNLILTAILLLCVHKFGSCGVRSYREMTSVDALRIGICQIFALLPGISRSGATISAAMLGNMNQKSARDFSFFLFIPVSVGAIILKLPDFFVSDNLSKLWLPYLIAFFISMIVTFVALKILFVILKKRKLNLFSYYCLAMGIISILFLG